MAASDLDRQLRAANALLERQDEALEQIMRRAVHGQALDLQSARGGAV